METPETLPLQNNNAFLSERNAQEAQSLCVIFGSVAEMRLNLSARGHGEGSFATDTIADPTSKALSGTTLRL